MYLILTILWNMLFSCSIAAFFSLWRHIIWNLDHDVVCNKLHWISIISRKDYFGKRPEVHGILTNSENTSVVQKLIWPVTLSTHSNSSAKYSKQYPFHVAHGQRGCILPQKQIGHLPQESLLKKKEEPCWALATWGYPESLCLHLSVYSLLLGTNWYLTLCGRMNIFTVKKGWSNCFSQIYATNVSSFIFYIYLSHEYFCILQIFGR